MEFITLHTPDNEVIFVNAKHIDAICLDTIEGKPITYLYMSGSSPFLIKETPDDIVKMIEAEKK